MALVARSLRMASLEFRDACRRTTLVETARTPGLEQSRHAGMETSGSKRVLIGSLVSASPGR